MFKSVIFVSLSLLTAVLAGGCPMQGSPTDVTAPIGSPDINITVDTGGQNTTVGQNNDQQTSADQSTDSDQNTNVDQGTGANDGNDNSADQEPVDTDGDGVPDDADGCPNDANKTAPGNCGCGAPETPDCGNAGGNDDVLYAEDFEDGVADGMTTYGSWTIGPGLSGSAHGYQAGFDHAVILLNGIPSDNVAIEADFTISSGGVGDFDIWVNATIQPPTVWRPAQGYIAMVNPAGSDNPDAWLVQYNLSGEAAPLGSSPNVIGANEPHHLRVERAGSSLRVLLDGNEIISAASDTYHNNQIGFRLFDGGTIDNIRVTRLP